MKSRDITNQLKGALPLFTSAFSTSLTASSIVVASDVATVTTATAHGLTTGDLATVRDAITPNTITSLTRVGNVATAVTAEPHNIAQKVRGAPQTVTISGAIETDYNGVKTLLSIPSQTSFTYKVENDPTTPATGSPVLEEFFILSDDDAGFTHINGVHQVTVTGTTTFTYATNAVPDVTAIGTPTVEVRPRISSSITLDRAIDSYTQHKQGELWAFVVLEDRIANRDRNINSDAVSSKSVGSDSRQLVIAPFTVYVFVPTSNDLSGRASRDIAEDLTQSMFKALLGVKFENNLSSNNWSEVSFIEHGIQDYNTAFYIHRYSFEALMDISFEDTAKANEVASIFRCIDFESTAEGGTDKLEATINLNT